MAGDNDAKPDGASGETAGRASLPEGSFGPDGRLTERGELEMMRYYLRKREEAEARAAAEKAAGPPPPRR